MKRKYVTLELELIEFKIGEVIMASPTIGNGSNDITDDFGDNLL